MQTKPIFFDCDLGRFQLVVTTGAERISLAATSCHLCDMMGKWGCEYRDFGSDCAEYDELIADTTLYRSVHWQKVLPTSESAKTPRTECGTIGKEVH